MAGGHLRRFHLEILFRVSCGDVSRGLDFEYYLTGRTRRVSEAIYLLESEQLVLLEKSGAVKPTDKGVQYLVNRGQATIGDTPAITPA